MPGRPWPRRVEWAAALLLTAFVCVLQVRRAVRAGPLWRDEISTVEVATSPTLADVYRNKVNDSGPLLWDGVVRAWAWLGPGRSDPGLRLLPLAVGVSMVGALWLNARLLGAATPVAALALLGLHGLAICYGGSVRVYGPGMLTGLLCAVALFHLSRSDGRRRTAVAFALAAAAALATVHVNYLDAAWLLAACLGGVAVCATHRQWRRAVAILAIGALSAASLAVYLNVFRVRAGQGVFFTYPVGLTEVWAGIHEALGQLPWGRNPTYDWAWQAAVAVAAVVGMLGAFIQQPAAEGPTGLHRRDAAVFSLVTLLVGLVAYVAVLRVLRDSLAHFHFLVLFALLATCVDGLLAGVGGPGRRLVITIAAVVAAVAWAGDAWRSAGVRMSNIDRVAGRLAALARPGDLIVADPWWLGGSVARYYHGPGDVVTLPPVADLRFQRFDLALPLFEDPHAVDHVLARMTAAMRAGHQVWFVLHPLVTLNGDPAVPLPDPDPTWDETDYYARWTLQVSRALQRDAGVRRVRMLDVDPASADVSPYEDLQLVQPTR